MDEEMSRDAAEAVPKWRLPSVSVEVGMCLFGSTLIHSALHGYGIWTSQLSKKLIKKATTRNSHGRISSQD